MYLHRKKMDGSAREPVAAHLHVSLLSPSSVAYGGKHVADSGGDTSIPYDFHHSLNVSCQGPLLLPAPQAASGPPFVPPEGQQRPVEAPVEPLVGAFAPFCETKELVGTSGLPPRCIQAVPGAEEAVGPASSLAENNQAMPRAAASFSFQEKDAAEPSGRPPAARMLMNEAVDALCPPFSLSRGWWCVLCSEAAGVRGGLAELRAVCQGPLGAPRSRYTDAAGAKCLFCI